MNFAYTVTPLCNVDYTALPGQLVKVGNDEKRRAENMVTVFDGRVYYHYVMFYKGLEKILITACKAISELVNTPNLEADKYAALFGVLLSCLWIVNHKSTDKRNSKLDGISSLSTCCLNNPFCIARMKDNDSVCSHCYAASQQQIQHGLTEHNIINGLILQNVGIPEWAWQRFKPYIGLQGVFRIESFGDIASVMQACNYITLVKAFPSVKFAAWTKNVAMWLKAFDMVGKPENLSFVTSSNHLNVIDEYHDTRINHSFTVYDHEYAARENVRINCGGRRCMDCITNHVGCYFTDTPRVISESLK